MRETGHLLYTIPTLDLNKQTLKKAYIYEGGITYIISLCELERFLQCHQVESGPKFLRRENKNILLTLNNSKSKTSEYFCLLFSKITL